ncbi:hypothetical protein L0F63_001099, partial [Massospora cicadina]
TPTVSSELISELTAKPGGAPCLAQNTPSTGGHHIIPARAKEPRRVLCKQLRVPKALEDKFEIINTSNGPRFQCKLCVSASLNNPDGSRRKKPKEYGSTTSSTNLKRHLINDHSAPSPAKRKAPRDPTTASSTSLASETAVAEFFARALVPYRMAAEPCFLHLMSSRVGFKRTSLEMKAQVHELNGLLRGLLVELFREIENKFTVTFDNWMNPQMRGYYTVTLHWIHSSPLRRCSVMLDFFYVSPRHGAGEWCAKKLETLLAEFGVGHKLLGGTVDQGGRVKFDSALLGREAVFNNLELAQDGAANRLLEGCAHQQPWVYKIQAGIRRAAEGFYPYLQGVCQLIETINGSKVLLEEFRKAYRQIFNRRVVRQPPSLDVTSYWDGHYVFLKELDHFSPVYVSLQSNPEFKGCASLFPSPELWQHIAAMAGFLQLPAELAAQLGGSTAYLSDAIISYKLLAIHCRSSMEGKDVLDSRGRPIELAASVQLVQQVATSFLGGLSPYGDSLQTPLTLIAYFLDPRVSTDERVTEPTLGYVREELSKKYRTHPSSAAKKSATAKAWEKLYATGATHDVSEETNKFVKTQGLPMDTDLLLWWSDHRKVFPNLYRMAMDYLTIPPASALHEQGIPSRPPSSTGELGWGASRLGSRAWLELLDQLNIGVPTAAKACRPPSEQSSLGVRPVDAPGWGWLGFSRWALCALASKLPRQVIVPISVESSILIFGPWLQVRLM